MLFRSNIYSPNHIYLYKDDNDKIDGIYVDIFNEITKKTGLKFEFNELDKEKIQSLVASDQGDIVFNMSKTAAREKDYFFLPTLNTYYTGLFTKENNKINLNNLSNLKIGYIENTSDYFLLKENYPDLKNLIPIKDEGNFGFLALKNGDIDILLGKSNYDLKKDYKFYLLDKIPESSLYMAINKKDPILKDIVQKYMFSLTEEDIANFLTAERPKYYSEVFKNDSLMSNLKNRYKEIKVLIPDTAEVLPLFYKDKNTYKGYIIDRLEELSKLIEIPIVYTTDPKSNYDIEAIDLEDLSNTGDYFIPYYESQIAAFSKEESNFIDNIDSLTNKKVGIIAFTDLNEDLLSGKYLYKDNREALTALLNNEIDYILGDFKVTSMAIANEYLEDKIKVAGFLDEKLFVGFQMKKDLDLAKVMNRLFPTQLSEYKILRSQLVIPKKLSPNYRYIILVSLVSLIIILILFYALLRAIKSGKKVQRINKALVESFEVANELNDEDTGNHILRINLYSKFLAQKLGCKKKFIQEISQYASLHDVGKIGISDNILKKPGKLTDEEFEKMKEHVSLGSKLVQKMQLGSIAENIALYHHEKWDGTGYSFKLKGKDIPLEARIVALADVYDALRQKRVYKDGFSHEKAMAIIKDGSGKHFDPKLVKIFLKYNLEFDKIFREN